MTTATASLIDSIERAYRNAFATSECYSKEQARPLARAVLVRLGEAEQLPADEQPDLAWFREIRGEMEFILR